MYADAKKKHYGMSSIKFIINTCNSLTYTMHWYVTTAGGYARSKMSQVDICDANTT